jgi:hypothetical protein
VTDSTRRSIYMTQIAPEALRHHLHMNQSRLLTSDDIAEEIKSYIDAQEEDEQAMSGTVGALSRHQEKNGGKSAGGKGKKGEKGKEGNGREKGKGKLHKGMGKNPEKGEQRKFGGACNWCWRIGHKEAQCWFRQAWEKEKGGAASTYTSAGQPDGGQGVIRKYFGKRGQEEAAVNSSSAMDVGAITYEGAGGYPVAAVTTGGVFCFALAANEYGEWDDPPPGNEHGEWDDPPPGKEHGEWNDPPPGNEHGEWDDPPPWKEYGWWEDPPPWNEYGWWGDPPPDPKEVPVPDDDDDELCDALEGIVAAAAARSVKILVDSGSIINACPEEFDPSTETRPPNRCWNLETVTGGSLKRYGFKPNVDLRTKQGIPMKVGFEVTNARRPILSVKKGAELGSMTIFAPDAAGPGKSMIINDPDAIDEVLRAMARTPGLRIDVESNSYVIDAGVVPKGNRGTRAWVDPPPVVAPVTDVVSNANVTRALGQAEREQRVDEKVKELHETEAEEAAIFHTVKIKAASQPYEPNKAE